MISINRCKYAGYSSVDFDLLTDLAFDSDSGGVSSFLSRESIASETYKGTYKRVHNYKWNEVLTPTITFVKNDFGNFDLDEQRKVLRWLTSKDTPSFLTIYHDDSEVVSYEILGAFTSIETYKNGNGYVIGFVAQFESIAPWAFSPLQTVQKTVSGFTDTPIIINIKSDDSQNPIYPKITIKQDATNSVIPVNHAYDERQDEWLEGTVYCYEDTYYWLDSDGVKRTSGDNTSYIETTSVVLTNTYTMNNNTNAISSKVKNNNRDETIILDGANKVISSSRTTGRIFGNDFIGWTWLPLFEGRNEISVLGNCEIIIQYREPRKVGEY